MKVTHITLGAILCAALAACGGGSSGGGITPTPIVTNQPAYTSQIVFVGVLAGRAIQADLRRAQSLSPMVSGTPVPIMVVSPMTAQDTIGNIGGSNGFGGYVEAVVSPMPSSSPSVTFTTDNPNSEFGTPGPSVTLPPGVIAQEPIGSNPSAINVQSAGTASAAISAPVNQSPTTNVYTYRAISLECASPLAAASSPAWAWSGSTWNAVSTIAAADIYMTGPYCDAPFNSSESETTVHFPGGGVTISTDTPFSGIVATQWANTLTSADLAALITLNPDGSSNGEIVFKTSSGAVVKLFPNGISRGSNPDYSGAVEVSGASIDGF